MREIEIKSRVDDLAGLESKLEALGVKMSEPIKQRDRVYGIPGVSGGGNNHSPWLRIREESKDGVDTVYFTYKKRVTKDFDSMEYETVVADGDMLHNIIINIGFEPYSEVTKIRRKGKFGDIEVCVDQVEGLGSFIEVEKLSDELSDPEVVKAELWDLFGDLGIDEKTQVVHGYDVMIKRLGKII